MIFVRLPDEVCIGVLSNWMTTFEWGRLDIAMSNKKLRVQFVNCLSALVTTLPISEESIKHCHRKNLIAFYQWTYGRNIRLTSLHLNDYAFDTEGSVLEFCFVRFEYILHLHATFESNDVVSVLLQRCVNLTGLSCRVGAINPSNVFAVSGLTSLELTDDVSTDYLNVESIQCVIMHCHRLKSFTCIANCPSNLLIEVLQTNCYLQDLDIICDAAIVEAIILKPLRYLQMLKIFVDNMNGETVGKLLKACPGLKMFEARSDSGLLFAYNGESHTLDWLTEDCADDTWYHPVMQLKNLKTLNFVPYVLPDDPCMVTIFEHVGSTLTSLQLSYSDEFETSLLRVLIELCPHLTCINLGSSFTLNWTDVILPGNNYKEVHLTGAYYVSDIRHILRECRHLECLVVCSAVACEPVAFEEIHVKQLKEYTSKYQNEEGTSTTFNIQYFDGDDHESLFPQDDDDFNTDCDY